MSASAHGVASARAVSRPTFDASSALVRGVPDGEDVRSDDGGFAGQLRRIEGASGSPDAPASGPLDAPPAKSGTSEGSVDAPATADARVARPAGAPDTGPADERRTLGHAVAPVASPAASSDASGGAESVRAARPSADASDGPIDGGEVLSSGTVTGTPGPLADAAASGGRGPGDATVSRSAADASTASALVTETPIGDAVEPAPDGAPRGTATATEGVVSGGDDPTAAPVAPAPPAGRAPTDDVPGDVVSPRVPTAGAHGVEAATPAGVERARPLAVPESPRIGRPGGGEAVRGVAPSLDARPIAAGAAPEAAPERGLAVSNGAVPAPATTLSATLGTGSVDVPEAVIAPTPRGTSDRRVHGVRAEGFDPELARTSPVSIVTGAAPGTVDAGGAGDASAARGPTEASSSAPTALAGTPFATRLESTSPSVPIAPRGVPLDGGGDAAEALAAGVRWTAGEGRGHAWINVTPAGLGPIAIRVAVEGDQVSVSIAASQVGAREALEPMLPRLREQLAADGHRSVDVDLSGGHDDPRRQAESGGQAPGNGDDRSGTGRAGNGSEEGIPTTSTRAQPAGIDVTRTGTGARHALVDAWA